MRNPDEWYPTKHDVRTPGEFPPQNKKRVAKSGRQVSRALQAKKGLKRLEELGLLKKKP